MKFPRFRVPSLKFPSFKAPRLTGCLLATIVLMLAVAVLSPRQLPVTLYKLSLVTFAGLVGYWLDREIFPYARPDRLISEGLHVLAAEAMKRRAIIVGAAMLAMGLGA